MTPVQQEPEATSPELRLLRIELSRIATGLNQLIGLLTSMAHDVRATRNIANVIEARTYPRRRKKAVGS